MKNGNRWFLRLQQPFGWVFACLWKQKRGHFSVGEWTERRQPLETVSQSRKMIFSRRLKSVLSAGGMFRAKSGGQCVMSATVQVWCFILLLVSKSLVGSSASPDKVYLRSLLWWGNEKLLKSTAQSAGTQTMRWNISLWYCNSTSRLAYGKALVIEFLPGTALHLGWNTGADLKRGNPVCLQSLERMDWNTKRRWWRWNNQFYVSLQVFPVAMSLHCK